MEVFIHSKNNLSKIVTKYIIFLLPLYIYGIYKNGIILYTKNLISFVEIFKLIYLCLIGIIGYVIVKIIFKEKLKLNLDFLYLFIIPLFMPFNVNYLIYFIGITLSYILFHFTDKYFNFNKLAFLKLLIVSLMLIGSLSYLNPAEKLNIYGFNILDILWGRGVGGIGSTSIILGVIILIILSIFNDHKYLISISAIASYLIFGLLLDQDLLLIGSNILALIFIAPDMISSPIKKTVQIIYGLLIGLLGIILAKFVSVYEGVFISILIFSIIYEIVCKIYKKVL